MEVGEVKDAELGLGGGFGPADQRRSAFTPPFH